MDALSQMKMAVGKAMPTNDRSFEVTLRFENVLGAPLAVEAINAAIDTVHCPTGFNGVQLALTAANLANTIYSAIKNAKPF